MTNKHNAVKLMYLFIAFLNVTVSSTEDLSS
jgi:hypothetical protein